MEELAQKYKALSEGTRLRIMALLGHGELCVCDLMAVLDLPQSTVSRHLASLRHAGLVRGERRGKWMYYRLVEAGDSLTRDLLTLLAHHLPGLEVMQKDHEALIAYLKRKDGRTCA